MTSEYRTVVIDNGSGDCKVGYDEESEPAFVFPSIVGHPKSSPSPQGIDHYVGDDACMMEKVLSFNYPIERGIVTNWDDMEKIWHYIYKNKLCIDPSEKNVIITEVSNNPKANREKTAQIFFETFNVPSFYLGNQCVFALYSAGISTGIVADVGYGVSQIAPIYDGYYIQHATTKLDLGGRDITAWLQKNLNERYNKATPIKYDIANEIKERHAFTLLEHGSDHNCNFSYNLPDGNSINVTEECIRCPELLFNPRLNDLDYDGIDKTLFNSIMKCDPDIQNDLFAGIVFSGGSMKLSGLKKRFEKEIKKLAPPSTKINFKVSINEKYSAFVGGSIFASLRVHALSAINKYEYKEYGASLVNSKCL